jgi:hypothetical protein
MEKTLRTFKCRNGTILREWPHDKECPMGRSGPNKDGYVIDYEVIEFHGAPTAADNAEMKGEWFALYRPDGVHGHGIPKGGAHGKGFDIVEEIKP